jgi:indolepyruvate ferredoxin oxidoreductase
MTSLTDRFTQAEDLAVFNGNEAVVKGGLESEVAFWSGYPGSPMAGIHTTLGDLSRRLFAEKGIVYHRALNEMTAAAELGGSQKAGVNGVTACKHVGLLWMTDQLLLENLTGTGENSGALVIVGDDVGATSSTVILDSRRTYELLKMPYLEPGSIQELKDFVEIGLDISRQSKLYVGMRVVAILGDGGGTIWVGPNRYSRINAIAKVDVRPTVAGLGSQILTARESLLFEKQQIALEVARKHQINTIINPEATSPLGFIASGKSYTDLYQALRDFGLHQAVRILKIGMPYPLDEALVLDFFGGLEQVVVIEEKEGLLEERIKALLYSEQRAGASQAIYGKKLPHQPEGFPKFGDLNPDLIKQKLAPLVRDIFPSARGIELEMTGLAEIAARQYRTTPLRVPSFCAGCPHRASVTLTRRLAQHGQPNGNLIPVSDIGLPGAHTSEKPAASRPNLLVHGDIGCYTMAALPPYQILDTISSMGQGGAVSDGLGPFSLNQKVAFIGDGAFIHSGRNSILSSVINKSDITYIILNNGTIAMTGGQATPITEQGLDIERIVRSYGVEHVTVIDTAEAYAASYERTLRRYNELPGVKIIIVNKECAIEKGRRERRELSAQAAQGIYPEWQEHYRINPDICEMCYDCGRKTACPGLDIVEPVDTVYGPKMQISKTNCVNDGACTQGECPSFQVLRIKRAEAKPPLPLVPTGALIEPAQKARVGDDGYKIYIPGVGGMGVLTVSALLAYAAMFDGKLVTFLNQTGLSQKNGAVVSHLIIHDQEVPHALFITKGKTDLFLALDLLEASRPDNLDMISPHQTRAVVNAARNQTVLNIAGVDQFPQTGSLTAQVQRYSQETTMVEGVSICEKLFGTSQYNNIFLMGVAYQRGYLPLSAASIEQAIRLNGKVVEANLAAFRWGRIYVSDRKQLEAQLATPPPKTAAKLAERNKGYLRRERNGEKLVAAYERLLGAAPLIDDELAYTMAGWLYTLLQFEDESYAQTYLDFVNQVYQQDRAGYGLTKVVAHNLARLMQIKDEFEVARLALSQEEQDRVRAEYHLKPEDRVEITYVLDPPWLRFLKPDQRKVHLSPRFQTRLLFGLLRRLKSLRGIAARWSAIRHFEFGLISWYRELIEQVLPRLTEANYNQAVSLADRARDIVGYDEVKLRNWQRIETAVKQDLARFLELETATEPLTTA